MWTTFKATVRTLLLTPSAVVWTLIFPIVLATVFNFMFEPMRSTGSVEAVDVAVVADDAWEDSPFSQVVDTLSEADEPLLAVHPVATEQEARELIAEGSVAGAYVVDAAGNEGNVEQSGQDELDAVDAAGPADAAGAASDPDNADAAGAASGSGTAAGSSDVSTVTSSAGSTGAPRIILAPAGSGTGSDASYDVNRAILESVATSYLQSEALIEELATHGPVALSDPTTIENALGLSVSVREVSLTHAQPDSMVRFYYALLGMASIFAAQLAGESVWRLQPTSSAAGARRAVSGTSRMRLLIPTIGACWAVSTTFLVIAFGYICLTAHIDFSGREGLCLVGIAASSLLSCGIGALVGALPGRMGSDSRRGILTALTCLLSLFAGLYGEPTMELADTVAHVFPAATWLNPVCLIRDLFYTVYYYDTLVPFSLRLAACAGIAAVLLAVSAACMRRSAHEHL
ncbi:ABC transporter permease [Collinsella stercoris]|uniref:ABC transporter permease n=1 Tax=Collinsella stercoris TaxID=147206 RepID=UPI0039925F6E